MDWSAMFFQNWSGIARIFVIGTLAYGLLVLMLRISGKRTLAKLNAFDLVVTVAFGSILATILLSKDVALAEGVAALALLIFLQWSVTALSVRLPAFADAIRAEPALLVRDGRPLRGAMTRERVTEDELESIVRARGHATIDAVAAVILESDGSFSVLPEGLPRFAEPQETAARPLGTGS